MQHLDPPPLAPELAREMPATEGVGPLLQRDYWCMIARCRVAPTHLMAVVARRFPEFAPEQLVHFSVRVDRELLLGDELDIVIRLVGHCRVRVVHRDAQTLTLLTLRGHPEAGRITFGAYRNAEGDVLFHIRSRARASSTTNLLGFVTTGEAMQTSTWTDFVQAAAHTFGDGPAGPVEATTATVQEESDEAEPRPTFEARGD